MFVYHIPLTTSTVVNPWVSVNKLVLCVESVRKFQCDNKSQMNWLYFHFIDIIWPLNLGRDKEGKQDVILPVAGQNAEKGLLCIQG